VALSLSLSLSLSKLLKQSIFDCFGNSTFTVIVVVIGSLFGRCNYLLEWEANGFYIRKRDISSGEEHESFFVFCIALIKVTSITSSFVEHEGPEYTLLPCAPWNKQTKHGQQKQNHVRMSQLTNIAVRNDLTHPQNTLFFSFLFQALF
jgi:hypothetical protein